MSVASVWKSATALLTILALNDFGRSSTGGVLAHSAAVTAVVCIAIGGPSTAVALFLRHRSTAARSAVGGLAAAALAFVLVFVVIGHAGLTALPAIAQVLAVIATEFAVAFFLRGPWARVQPR